MEVNDDPPSEESNPEMVQVDVEEGMRAIIFFNFDFLSIRWEIKMKSAKFFLELFDD